MGVRTAVSVGVSAVITREKLNLSELPLAKKSPHDFLTLTASDARYPKTADFSDARVGSVESSIKIVNDDDSVTRAGNPAPPCFKFMLSIM